MNFKYIIISALAIISIDVFAQKDVVGLIIDGKKIGERTIIKRPAIIRVSKLKYKNISAVTLILKQQSVYNVYKRTIELTDKNENNLYQVNESASKHGWYKINLAAIRSALLKQKVIKVYLAENPANEMMKLPSRRKLLAELHFS